MQSEIIDVIVEITQTLETLQIPYVIGGSVASTAYGRIRTTIDVDMVVNLETKHVEPLVTSFEKDFYIDTGAVHQAIQNQGDFNLIHLETMFKADVFVKGDQPFGRQQINRRRPLVLQPLNQTIYIASPEDILLAKLEWYRLGNEVSDRQWQDIQGILDTQREQLDRTYLQEWAITLQVDDLLAHALLEYQPKLIDKKDTPPTEE